MFDRFPLAGANFNGINISTADLADAQLQGSDFREADLSGANLYYADLSRCNLGNALLCGANLARSTLQGARLDRADISEADLRDADLRDATFHYSQLIRANLSGAEVGGADLAESTCVATVFGDVDLSEVRGLESIFHHGPSTIGIDTLFKSRGKIPEAFLRGCGVPEEMIRYIPSLIGSQAAMQFYSCFISYSHKDEDFAKRLHGRMQQENLRVWYAPEDMKRGRKIHEQIEQAIQVNDRLLLILSPHSMASEWVNHEIYTTRQREKKEGRHILFPIRLCPFEQLQDWKCMDADTGRDMAREIREYLIPDFSGWKDNDVFEREFAGLLRDLRKAEQQ